MAMGPAIDLAELKPGKICSVRIGDVHLAFYLIAGEAVCTVDQCTHEECLLSEVGFVDGDEVECGCHGARFNLKTGAVTMPPATDPLATLRVETRGSRVYVDLDEVAIRG